MSNYQPYARAINGSESPLSQSNKRKEVDLGSIYYRYINVNLLTSSVEKVTSPHKGSIKWVI